MNRKDVYFRYINVFREVMRRMSQEPELKPRDFSKILALAGIYRDLESKYGSHPYWEEKFNRLIEDTLDHDVINPQQVKEYLIDIHHHIKIH